MILMNFNELHIYIYIIYICIYTYIVTIGFTIYELCRTYFRMIHLLDSSTQFYGNSSDLQRFVEPGHQKVSAARRRGRTGIRRAKRLILYCHGEISKATGDAP